ncbi:AAA family ATPase [Dyadobacter flavalbus]|uniref:AAA family ATPase n=1 Tax=Dyadobacter flavalbus TaxID=2579942 RepID=A0A5M8QLQ1_9BACT|nr:AAA family ATPase [Dyadobacter flavalbus]KAA6437075.1 AAA family ATPase [Dyadobacter flavalbus]
MKLAEVKIKGFRSFGKQITIKIRPDLTGFIGLNSSGKTSAMDALRKMFSSTFSEREFQTKDFHHFKGEVIEDLAERFLSIETHFSFGDNPDAIPHFFSGMVAGNPGETPYLRVRLESCWKKSQIEPDGEIETNMYTIRVPEGEEVSDGDKLPFPGHLRSLIQVIYVPAIRRPSEQLKYASGSLLHRVLRKIKWSEAFTQTFKQQIKEINNGFKALPEFDTVERSINQFWQQFHREERYRETYVGFGDSDFDSILKKLEISFGPTATTNDFRLDELGDGLRSLFYLTLVCSLLDIEEQFAAKADEDEIGKSRPLLTLFAIEEPENHIAPQLLGRVVRILDRISKTGTSQVILSSHTPAIIKRIDPEAIRHFRISRSYQTKVRKISLPKISSDAYKYVRQAVINYPEIYFAKVVVIGEGDSEGAIFNRLMRVFDLDFDDNMITFAPLGHRFVNHIWKLLDTLGIPYVTLLDFDLERTGGAWGRIKYALQQLLLIGFERNDLLLLSDDSVMSEQDLDTMHTWDIGNETNLNAWVNRVKKYDVFYSGPLDIDFLMLTSYDEFYKEAIPDGGGPDIPDPGGDPDAFDKKIKAAVKATLKSEKAVGKLYSQQQKELMIWYNYHFLGRGKPATHIEAMSLMTDEQIRKGLPSVFKEIFKRIQGLLRTEADEKN